MLVFTSCMNNYLPKARVLAESVKKQHLDWEFCLLLGEEPPPGFDLASEPFDRVMSFEELGIANYPAWYFQHRLVEICTAVKGRALNYFLEQEKQQKVIYLDPDILVLASLQPLADLLDEYDLLLTPHQLAPQNGAQAIKDNEICSLRHGIFNLGFVACACRGDGIAFSRFWRDRLADWCFDDKENGLFTDQKWCDLAPAYFPRLGIVRDSGYNAASWNLTDRIITEDSNGHFFANDQPLRFYHFTGHDSGMGKIMSQIYGAKMPAVQALWQLYDEKLAKAGHEQLKRLPWSGSKFTNGEPVSDEARLHYRQNPPLQAIFPDPLHTDPSGKEGYAGYWRSLRSKENNPFYVWGRKPFRLYALAKLYLERNGGLKAAPALFSKVRNIWRQEGLGGVLAKVRKFKQNMGVGLPALELAQILKPPSQWAKKFASEFRDKKGVLILDHMYGGGANEYREKRIAQFLSSGRPVLLLTWDFFSHNLKCDFRLPDKTLISARARDLQDLMEYKDLAFGNILINELVLWSGAGFRNNHYAALSHLSTQLIALKKRDHATLEIALHDYYSICPSYYLLDDQDKYCGVPNDPQRCRKCLLKSPFNIPENFDLANWRKIWETLFANADKISAFSESAAGILKNSLKIPQDRLQVQPHEPLAQLESVSVVSGPLCIGVIGHIAHHKGAEIVNEIGKLLKPEEKLVVIGKLETQNDISSQIKVTGWYQRENLPAIIAREGVNCLLIPSIWPETFCYTAQEAMQLNLPLVVFPIGAQAERTKTYVKGAIAPEISAQAALDTIRRLYYEPSAGKPV